MIIDSCLLIVLNIIIYFISLVPAVPSTEYMLGGFLNILGIGINLFGRTTFSVIITNIVLWGGIHLAWAIIEWIYIKIPGVN